MAEWLMLGGMRQAYPVLLLLMTVAANALFLSAGARPAAGETPGERGKTILLYTSGVLGETEPCG